MAATDDPAYQAYLKALGFEEDLARADAKRLTEQTRAGAKLAKPELMAQGVERREGISDSYEDRGMYLGSERLRSLAGQQRGEQYQLALIDKGQADQLAAIDMAMQRELAGLNRTRLSAQQAHEAWLLAKAQAEAEGVAVPVPVSTTLTAPPGLSVPLPSPTQAARLAESRGL